MTFEKWTINKFDEISWWINKDNNNIDWPEWVVKGLVNWLLDSPRLDEEKNNIRNNTRNAISALLEISSINVFWKPVDKKTIH